MLNVCFECSEEYVDVMTSIGNAVANQVWEGSIGEQVKPLPNSSRLVIHHIGYSYY